MKTSEFDFHVPAELIAHEPAKKRDYSRLMVLDRARQSIEHRHFYDLADYLRPGDLLVLNDTKVIPANLAGRKAEGSAKVEVLLAKLIDPAKNVWECLVKPGKRLSVGSRVVFDDSDVVGTVLEKTESGEQIIEFTGDLEDFMKKNGQVPLPPYIKAKSDLSARYQTVYAKNEGASAAPTAGLHFTPELLDQAKAKGVGVAPVTLHTGLATFKPVYAENVEEHRMYSEHYEVSAETVDQLKQATRIIAVGTTSVRTLESMTTHPPTPSLKKRGGGVSGETSLFIYPGYEFKVVNAMVTNFHWPRTSLIMLVAAFAGKDFIMSAYQEAIREKYRFFSFGDAMLIL
jgi:S-adenosylmethionine:tRNA ribosyltransferase-isomerase